MKIYEEQIRGIECPKCKGRGIICIHEAGVDCTELFCTKCKNRVQGRTLKDALAKWNNSKKELQNER